MDHINILSSIAFYITRKKTLKSFARVRKACPALCRPKLFETFVYAAHNDYYTVDRCIVFLREHEEAAHCIKAFALGGSLRQPVPELSFPLVYEFLRLLPNLCRLQIAGFVWVPGSPENKPVIPSLRRIILGSMFVQDAHDSPLGLLDIVPKWRSIHLTDIHHATEPVFFDNSVYGCTRFFLHHDRWSEPAHSLPAHSSKFKELELLVGHNVDVTHALAINQLMRGSYQTLHSIVLLFNAIQSCTLRFLSPCLLLLKLFVGGDPNDWPLGGLRASTNLVRFTISVPLDQSTQWLSSDGVRQNIFPPLLSHFVHNLPDSCRCLDLHVGLAGDEPGAIMRNFLSINWAEIGRAVVHLPHLDSIFVRFYSFEDNEIPEWTITKLNIVRRAIPLFGTCRGTSYMPTEYINLNSSPS